MHAVFDLITVWCHYPLNCLIGNFLIWPRVMKQLPIMIECCVGSMVKSEMLKNVACYKREHEKLLKFLRNRNCWGWRWMKGGKRWFVYSCREFCFNKIHKFYFFVNNSEGFVKWGWKNIERVTLTISLSSYKNRKLLENKSQKDTILKLQQKSIKFLRKRKKYTRILKKFSICSAGKALTKCKYETHLQAIASSGHCVRIIMSGWNEKSYPSNKLQYFQF